jgi:hypothetical protein
MNLVRGDFRRRDAAESIIAVEAGSAAVIMGPRMRGTHRVSAMETRKVRSPGNHVTAFGNVL